MYLCEFLNHVQTDWGVLCSGVIISEGSDLKSIRVHLSPGSSCGLVVYTLHILAQRYTFFMGHTAIYLLTGRDSGLMTISLDLEAYEESTGLSGFKIG